MSGGSLDYVSFKVDDAIARIEQEDDPLYRAFAKHLVLISKALHEVEWVLSADTRKGDQDYEAIKAVLSPADVEESLRYEIKRMTKVLNLAKLKIGKT